MDTIGRKLPEKVRAIKGEFQRDVVTKAEMQEAVALQATAWLAEKNAREFVQRIEFRIMNGANIEDCEFVFDSELQMVRTKRERAVVDGSHVQNGGT